ncbi:short chain dehydrogenase [Phanerochaete sordida]|uniref:Short chain dehydrogenase n=1 Tax=Phanerochaete sordida TaxID=48140 RepID=A0A9P3GC55_9APHY|nr:short chain dehydrogenase [Phanerochaete sordida]
MAKITFWSFFSEQWTRLPPPLLVDLAGKTVIVTGANSGIGLEAAKHFARMKPARLVVACRSEGKGKAALEEIAKAIGFAAELQLVDFADFACVQAFVARLKDAPVDILIANAAVALPEYKLTKDGWEETLQVNHLATALLSILLLPNMARAAREHNALARLVLVASGAHRGHTVDAELRAAPAGILRTMSSAEFCTPARFAQRYPESKLLNIFFARALAAHLAPGALVVPTAANPGFCYSGLRRHLPLAPRLMMGAMDVTLGRSAEQGARQLLHAALGPDGRPGAHVRFMAGAYVSCGAVREPSDYVLSAEGYEAQEKIWEETIEILAEIAPDVRRIAKEYFQ